MVNPHLHVVRCSNDEVLVKQGTRSLYSEIVSDDSRAGLLGAVVDAFRSPRAVTDVVGALDGGSDDAMHVVEGLRARNVLVAPDEELAAVYVRTFYGADIAATSVGIIGAGVVGRQVAEGLRGAGVEQFAVYDPRIAVADDPVTAKCFDGLPPDRVALGPSSDFGIEAVFAQSDVVVVSWEWFSPKLLTEVNLASIESGTPWLPVVVDGAEVVVGPTTVPGESACWFEYLVQTEASLMQKDAYTLFRDHLDDMDLAVSGAFVLPPLAQVAGGLASVSVVRLAAGQHVPTLNRTLRVDLDRFSIDYQHVLRLPRCPACGPSRAAYRQLFL
ncbi:MAG TPA: TOMM precursor leader peptide-binding protein [Frankiaceae bacterium]|nr:TOMM precursor leader peptide-binding protein [Frankiaceae bacterium]